MFICHGDSYRDNIKMVFPASSVNIDFPANATKMEKINTHTATRHLSAKRVTNKTGKLSLLLTPTDDLLSKYYEDYINYYYIIQKHEIYIKFLTTE